MTKGFDELISKAERNPNIYKNCLSCDFYYKSEDDSEEVCQNGEVLQYDMVVEDNIIYCCYWRLSVSRKYKDEAEKFRKLDKEEQIKRLFKKG